jgi:hypothetical protein
VRLLAADYVARLEVGHLDEIGEHVVAPGLSHGSQFAKHLLKIVERVGSPLHCLGTHGAKTSSRLVVFLRQS